MVPGGDRKNDLFIVGDAHHRTYRHKVVLNLSPPRQFEGMALEVRQIPLLPERGEGFLG